MKTFVIIAHMKNYTKKYFNKDESSGGYGYVSEVPQVFTSEVFFNDWEEYFKKHPQSDYNKDVAKIEKKYFNFLED